MFFLSMYTYPSGDTIANGQRYFAHVHDQDGIIKKVSEYIAMVKGDLIASGQLDASLPKDLAFLLDDERKQMDYNELMEQISYVAVLGSEYVDTVDITHMLLMRVAGQLSLYVREILLQGLLRLDREIMHWEYVRYHPMYYFFHKSPKKLLETSDQTQHVRNNIAYLRAVQEEHFRILGLLTTHIGQFDADVSSHDVMHWLMNLISIMSKIIGSNPITMNADADFTHCINHMKECLYRTVKHDSFIKKTIQRTHKDNHFERNWVRYATGLTGSLLLISYGYKYRKQLPEWGKNTRKTLKKMTIEPLREFKDAFVKSESKEDLQKTYEETIMRYKKDLGTLNNLSKQEIKRAAKKLDLDFLENRVLGQIGKDFTEKKAGQQEVKFESTNFGKLFGKAFKFNADNLNLDPILYMIPTVPHVVPFLLLYGRVYKENLLRRNRVMLALTAFLPMVMLASGCGLLMNKFYRLIKRRPHYDTIQSAMKEIVDLLNVYGDAHPTEMLPQDYGKLIYFVYKLKKEKAEVPEKYLRVYAHDIRKLESNVLTAEQKMNVIEFMYRSYPFLACE